MPDSNQYIGGVATVVNNYLLRKEQFANNGYSVSLFDYKDSQASRIKIGFLKKIVFGIHQAKELLSKAREENADIVHIHTSRNSLFVKDVFVGAYLSKRIKSKICITVHVGDISTVYEKIPSFMKRVTIKLLNKHFYKVFFLSKEIRKQFVSSGLEDCKSCVLYNSCNITHVKDTNKTIDDRINILFVGMINKDKGIIELLDAIADPDLSEHVVCHICGEITDSSIKEVFEKKYSQVKKYTYLHGYVTGREKELLFSNCDVLVLPSYHEGFPIVILEGITCGCAIVATRVGAIPEILNDDNCIFVNIGDTQSIVSALVNLKNDRVLLERMKENNARLSTEFSLSNHICKLCEFYGV